MGSTSLKNVIRVLAALYVGYLGIQLLREEARKSGILMPIVGVAFILAALFILFITFRKSIKADQVSLDDMQAVEDDTEDINETEAAEEFEAVETLEFGSEPETSEEEASDQNPVTEEEVD